MGFNNSNGSFSRNNNNGSWQQAKRVLPRIQSVPKSSNPYSLLKDGLRVHEAAAGLECKHRKKAAPVFPESEIKDIDIEKKLNLTEGLSDERDCLWLSSDCKSPSLRSLDDSQDVWEFDCCDISLHDQFSSMLSLSGTSGAFLDKNKGVSIFDGSKISPIDEASLLLDRPREGTGRKHLQEKVVIWLHNTDGNDELDSSLGCSESGDSSYATSLCEESSMFESSCTSLSTYDDTLSYVRDFDDIWVSLLDLKREDSELVQDREQGIDVFSSDFPSPCNPRRNCLIGSSDSSSITYFGRTEEAKSPSEDSAADEPLFWPFDHNSYWRPELDKDFLCISPRRDRRNPGIQELNGSKSISLRLHQKSNPPVASKNMHRCRRILFGSTPKLATADCRSRGLNNNGIPKMNTPASRLSGSTQAPSEQNPSNISIKQKSLQLKASRSKHSGNQELLSKRLLELEASDIQDLVMEGVPIEKLVGLNEFNGHEGINMEFDESQFTLHGSPYKKTFSLREIERLTDNSDHKGSGHATLGSCKSNLDMDDYWKADAKGREDLTDVQSGDPHAHDPKLSV